jgi:hypothetical protein
MQTFSSLLRVAAKAISASSFARLILFVESGVVLASCASYTYTYELIPGKNRTALTEPEIAEACTIVDRIALTRRMQRLTPLRPAALRCYTRDKYIFPIGEDITSFGLSLVSGGRGLEFGAISANSGDVLSNQLLRETVASFDSHFGKGRLVKHSHPFYPRLFWQPPLRYHLQPRIPLRLRRLSAAFSRDSIAEPRTAPSMAQRRPR